MANPTICQPSVCASIRCQTRFLLLDNAVPPHHFHLGQDIYAAVTYFVLPPCKFIYDNMEEMKTIGFTQLKKVSVCRLCSGNPLQIESS
ncbi:hypothetical protein TNCT_376581 [Trichonephila clavata]|uniref:Uncharacterized protein n=1 Tax=Trichonephila clavata TaxID=2740835 RepID=A0A8X6LCI7_TRICU|nr:hypothetical protein TNCT_376581 [Trichonephila clavata]